MQWVGWRPSSRTSPNPQGGQRIPEEGSCPRTERGRDPHCPLLGAPLKRGTCLRVCFNGAKPWRDLPYLDPEPRDQLQGPQRPAQTPHPGLLVPPVGCGCPVCTHKKWGETQPRPPFSIWHIPRAGEDPGTIRQRQAGRMQRPRSRGEPFSPSLFAF